MPATDWLSDSITPDPASRADGSEPEIATNALPPEITVMPLGRSSSDALGLLPIAETGLPRDLWGASPSGMLARLIGEAPDQMLPAMNALLTRLLLAKLDPPRDSDAEATLFLARIDRLLSLGALEPAQALLEQAGAKDSRLFRRAFDVALLTGSEDRACRRLRTTPDIAPSYPARIFCLARGGDWHTAALTLESAEALDLLNARDDALLARFLDAELAEDAEPLRPPPVPSPLVFRLFEAIGTPLSTARLPIAFAHADLSERTGWKARLMAAERLARGGAISPERLAETYGERSPAASGGVWKRVAAFQAFEAAFTDGDQAAVAGTIGPAWQAAEEAEIEVPFAELYGARLAELPLPEPEAALAFQIGLLSAHYEDIAASRVPASDAERFLIAVAKGRSEPGLVTDDFGDALRDGFAATAAPAQLQPLMDGDRQGEAILRAILLFSDGATGDLTKISEATAFFRSVGLEDVARRTALQLMILDRRR